MYHPIEFPLNGTNGTLVFVKVLSNFGPRRVAFASTFDGFWCVFPASPVGVCSCLHQLVGGAHAQERPKKYPSRTGGYTGGVVMNAGRECVNRARANAVECGTFWMIFDRVEGLGL
jgi:hypothetical protein